MQQVGTNECVGSIEIAPGGRMMKSIEPPRAGGHGSLPRRSWPEPPPDRPTLKDRITPVGTCLAWATPRRVPKWSRFGTRRASGRRLSVARLTRAVKKHVADTTPIMKTKQFDWHADPIPRTTPVTSTYRNTQNVQRFLPPAPA